METDSQVEQGKLFVGGLSWDTKEEGFKKYFEGFGEVKDIKIMQDANGKPRGFGFVTFHDPACVHQVLGTKVHCLDNKKIDPKPATEKPRSSTGATLKVFVGGIPSNCVDEDLKAACSEFGVVSGVDIKGKQGEKHRGFAFVDFEDENSVDNICKKHFIVVNDKRVEVKKAEPRKSRNPQQQQQQEMQQQSYPQGAFNIALGRSMGGPPTGHYMYPYQSFNGFTTSQPYPGQYTDYQGSYGGQQGPMTSFPDTTAGYSQPRGAYGTSTTDQYSGATSYSAYEQHLGYSYSADQSRGMSYSSHAATPQQRSGYTTYGRS